MKRGEVFEDSRGLRKPLKRRRVEDTQDLVGDWRNRSRLTPVPPAPLTQPGAPRILARAFHVTI
jgi:hypothetical protein